MNLLRHWEKLNLLWALLDVADIVATHRACAHVADERKEFILWQERKQSCIQNRTRGFQHCTCHQCVPLITHCRVRLWRAAQTGDLDPPRSLQQSDRLQTRPWSPCRLSERRSSPEPDPGRCSVGTHGCLTAGKTIIQLNFLKKNCQIKENGKTNHCNWFFFYWQSQVVKSIL